MKYRFSILLILFTAIHLGCSADKQQVSTTGMPEARDGLLDLAELLKTVQKEGGSLPAKREDFKKHDVMYPAAGTLVTNKTIDYFIGGKIDPDDSEPKIVGMQANADQTGGWVLLTNGEVKDLTADEVGQLPKSGKPLK